MSRKPTAINLDEAGQAEPKKVSAGKSKSAKVTSSSPRKPTALKPPPPAADEDYFDQTPFVDGEEFAAPPMHAAKQQNGLRWASILLAAIGLLFSITIVYELQNLIRDYFAVHPALGWVVFSLSIIAGIALVFLILREIVSLMRLRKLKNIREDAEQVLLGTKPAQKSVKALVGLYAQRSEMRWHLDKLKSFDDDILDGPDRIHLAEKHLLVPLDTQAKKVIASAAKRISVITALNPSPVLDILFVGFQVLKMLRQIMAIYGGRPAFFGALKLVRMVAGHLAVTGGLAISDTLLQQFLGKGLAGRLSSKLGEGTVNGIMTTRIGLAAMDLCRPLSYSAVERPSLKSFLGELFGG